MLYKRRARAAEQEAGPLSPLSQRRRLFSKHFNPAFVTSEWCGVTICSFVLSEKELMTKILPTLSTSYSTCFLHGIFFTTEYPFFSTVSLMSFLSPRGPLIEPSQDHCQKGKREKRELEKKKKGEKEKKGKREIEKKEKK